MAVRYSREATGVLDGTRPPLSFNGAVQGDLRRMRASIDLATVGAVTASDQVVLGELPAGAAFAFGVLTCSVTLATSVVAIGTGATHATNGQFRAAAVSTAVETPALFGITTGQIAAPSAAKAAVYLTVATATLPTTGIVNVDIFYSMIH